MRGLGRVGITSVLALGILGGALPSESQQAAKAPRIGYLDAGWPAAEFLHLRDAFRQGLSQFGYREGVNIVIEYRWAEGRYDRLPELAAELVGLRADVIVAGITQAARAAKQTTTGIPIVMVGAVDPVRVGLVKSLARPGGNVTGLSNLSPEMSAKQLELLKEAVPRVSRVAILWNAADPTEVRLWRARQGAARALGLTLIPMEVRSPDDFAGAFSAMTRERPEALQLLGQPLILRYRRQLVEWATKNGLPIISDAREFTDAGGLMSYGVHLPDMYRRAAYFVDKILNGARAADLPVEQPTRFEVVINLKTARALGLTIPGSVLIRADHLIQ